MLRKMTVIVLVLALSGIVGSCAPAAPAEILVGINAEITGAIPMVGAACKNSAEMAAEEVNSAGGLDIGGKKYTIKLVIADNENKPESAAAAATKLIAQDKVLIHIGANASKNAIPASSVCNELQCPMISPWSTNPNTTLYKPWVFRACFIDSFQAGVNAQFGQEEFGTKNGAVLFDIGSDACYYQGFFFKETWEKLGGKIVAFETFTTGDKDFTAQLTKIKDSGADVLYVPQYYDEVPLIVQQANRLGVTDKIHIIGHDGWESPDLCKLCGADCNGLFFTTHWAVDIAGEKTQAFINKYKSKYGVDPDSVAGLTYDSMYLFFRAAQDCGKLTGNLANDRKCIREALANMKDFEGVTGTMTPTEMGDMIKSVHIVEIDCDAGVFKWFKTVEPKTF